jgi:hypothetical protein
MDSYTDIGNKDSLGISSAFRVRDVFVYLIPAYLLGFQTFYHLTYIQDLLKSNFRNFVQNLKKIEKTATMSKVYNGIPDWATEEDILEDSGALWWSPDAKKLTWGHFDVTDVEPYYLPEYGSWTQIEPYPSLKTFKYSKVRPRLLNLQLER